MSASLYVGRSSDTGESMLHIANNGHTIDEISKSEETITDTVFHSSLDYLRVIGSYECPYVGNVFSTDSSYPLHFFEFSMPQECKDLLVDHLYIMSVEFTNEFGKKWFEESADIPYHVPEDILYNEKICSDSFVKDSFEAGDYIGSHAGGFLTSTNVLDTTSRIDNLYIIASVENRGYVCRNYYENVSLDDVFRPLVIPGHHPGVSVIDPEGFVATDLSTYKPVNDFKVTIRVLSILKNPTTNSISYAPLPKLNNSCFVSTDGIRIHGNLLEDIGYMTPVSPSIQNAGNLQYTATSPYETLLNNTSDVLVLQENFTVTGSGLESAFYGKNSRRIIQQISYDIIETSPYWVAIPLGDTVYSDRSYRCYQVITTKGTSQGWVLNGQAGFIGKRSLDFPYALSYMFNVSHPYKNTLLKAPSPVIASTYLPTVTYTTVQDATPYHQYFLPILGGGSSYYVHYTYTSSAIVVATIPNIRARPNLIVVSFNNSTAVVGPSEIPNKFILYRYACYTLYLMYDESTNIATVYSELSGTIDSSVTYYTDGTVRRSFDPTLTYLSEDVRDNELLIF